MVSATHHPFDKVKPENVFFGTQLGEGAFGEVLYGWLKSNPKKKYAIKAMKKAVIMENKHVDHVENEKTLLATFQHPFVVSLSIELIWC